MNVIRGKAEQIQDVVERKKLSTSLWQVIEGMAGICYI